MYENLPDEEAAIQADQKIQALEREYRRGFIERGQVLCEVESRSLWKFVIDPQTLQPFTSFERWILVRAVYSRSDCYEALRAVKELQDIPPQELIEIPRCNVQTLRKISTAIRREPAVIAAAKTCSEEEFTSNVGRWYPDQHIERRRKIILNPSQSQYDAITAGLKDAMEYYGVGTKEEAVEAVLADWRLSEKVEQKIEAFTQDRVM